MRANAANAQQLSSRLAASDLPVVRDQGDFTPRCGKHVVRPERSIVTAEQAQHCVQVLREFGIQLASCCGSVDAELQCGSDAGAEQATTVNGIHVFSHFAVRCTTG